MNVFKKESKILDWLRGVRSEDVYFLTQTPMAEGVFQVVHSAEDVVFGDKPDIHFPSNGLMVEVMRVDDHEFMGKKKLINPMCARESKVEKTLRAHPLVAMFPNADIYINADTGLSTDDDHTYQRYVDNFSRIVDDHANHVPSYRDAHPGETLAFLVFDDTAGYVELQHPSGVASYNDGKASLGVLHRWWEDDAFLNVISRCGADYFIWHTPNRRILRESVLGAVPIDVPLVCIFDVNAMASAPHKGREYDELRIRPASR